MKKHFIPAALALVLAAPAHAQSVNDTHIKRTVTAVEKAAIEQGFISRSAGTELLGGTEAQQPDAIGDHSVTLMAPEAVEAAPPAAAPGNRPSLIRQELPAGLVMDGPGTEAYKKRKRKKAAMLKKQEAAPVREEKPLAAPVAHEEPVALPDENALPPSTMPVAEPVPAMEPPAMEPAPEMDSPGELAPPDDPFGQ